MSAVKKTPMTLGVKRRSETAAIADEAVEAFASGAETERKKTSASDIERVVRDSFTMPECDYVLIAQTQQRCLGQGLPMTKGEVLRAGLRALDALSDTALHGLAGQVEKVKTGRPKR